MLTRSNPDGNPYPLPANTAAQNKMTTYQTLTNNGIIINKQGFISSRNVRAFRLDTNTIVIGSCECNLRDFELFADRLVSVNGWTLFF